MPDITRKQFYIQERNRIASVLQALDETQANTENGAISATIADKKEVRDSLLLDFEAADRIVKAIEKEEGLAGGISSGLILAEDAIPAIVGVKGGYAPSMSRSLQNAWGFLASQKYCENLLALTCGLNEPETNYVTPIPPAETRFEYAPVLIPNINNFFQQMPFKTGIRAYANSTERSYPPVVFCFLAVTNNAASDKDVTIKFHTTSSGNYGAATINMLVPDQDNLNRADVATTTFTNEFSYDSNGDTLHTGTVSIPVNKSVILLMTGAAREQSTNYFASDFYLENGRDIFSDPDIVPDFDIIRNIHNAMTGRDQSPGYTSLSTIMDLWKVSPPMPALNVIQQSQNVFKMASKTYAEYADNAAAVAGGLSAGDLYINSSSKALTVVI